MAIATTARTTIAVGMKSLFRIKVETKVSRLGLIVVQARLEERSLATAELAEHSGQGRILNFSGGVDHRQAVFERSCPDPQRTGLQLHPVQP